MPPELDPVLEVELDEELELLLEEELDEELELLELDEDPPVELDDELEVLLELEELEEELLDETGGGSDPFPPQAHNVMMRQDNAVPLVWRMVSLREAEANRTIARRGSKAGEAARNA